MEDVDVWLAHLVCGIALRVLHVGDQKNAISQYRLIDEAAANIRKEYGPVQM
jgi:hypothetical protein